MAYDSAGSIISDAAAELGLGTVTDAYGSSDANVIQLRGLLKGAGKKLVRDLDWSHLRKEYSFVTRQNWAASTNYCSSSLNNTPWTANNSFNVNDLVTNAGNLYRCIAQTSNSALTGPGPNTTNSSISDGGITWKYQNAGAASMVVRGGYYYTCTTLTTGTSGTIGPLGNVVGGTEIDGGVTWTCSGFASDYALPSDFSNLIDQTGWNRTNRLPVGGPVDGQMWQYLKGRQQGVVFNVLFRPVAGVLRLYPDTDTPGGYQITFEYTSSWWAGSSSSTAPTADAPTANSDIVYFDSLMMVRRLKLEWLQAKGFDTTHAQRAYDEAAEQTMNADGSAPILNLSGRGPWDPLIGAQNIPPTGFGS